MAEQMTTRAIVSMTVEVDLGTTWNPDAQVAQVFRQGAEDAFNRITKILAPSGARVIGKPRVTAVMSVEVPK